MASTAIDYLMLEEPLDAYIFQEKIKLKGSPMAKILTQNSGN